MARIAMTVNSFYSIYNKIIDISLSLLRLWHLDLAIDDGFKQIVLAQSDIDNRRREVCLGVLDVDERMEQFSWGEEGDVELTWGVEGVEGMIKREG